MAENAREINAPQSLAQALSLYLRNPRAILVSGGTAPNPQANPSEPIISLSSVAELKQMARTERYLDIGAAVTLNEIIERGERAMPPLLIAACKGVATQPVRNLATIGGNLACPQRRMSLFPICAALDAQAELRTETAARWVPVSRLWNEKKFNLEPFEILTRVRFPLDSWDVEIARNVGSPQYPDDSSFMYVFLARANRGILGDFRLIFSGLQFFRRRDVEGSLIGKRLPLSGEDRSDIIQMYREALALDALFLPTLRQAQCLRLLTNDLELLS